MRVESGAVVDEFELSGIGHVVARFTRVKTAESVTWACMFTVVAPGNSDLAVVHRLGAPSLAEARRSVRHAVEFLAGRAAGADVPAAWRPPAFQKTEYPNVRQPALHPSPEPVSVGPPVPSFRVPLDS
jgi:hypothetical protein